MNDVAINGGTVVLPDGPILANLGIRDGRITSISDEPLTADQVLDASRQIV